MSSGCGDVLSLEDLKTAKKHQTFEAEVITGRAGGVSSGAEIDFATNQVTGQVQKTLPAILRDMGFDPAAFDFTTGGTVTARDTVVYNPADNNWYSWAGTLPHVVAPGTNPLLDANWKPRTDQLLRQNLASNYGYSLIGSFPSWASMKNSVITEAGKVYKLKSYVDGHAAIAFPAGGGEFISKFGAAVDDGGSICVPSINNGYYLERLREVDDINLAEYGVTPTSDITAAFKNAVAYSRSVGITKITIPPNAQYYTFTGGVQVDHTRIPLVIRGGAGENMQEARIQFAPGSTNYGFKFFNTDKDNYLWSASGLHGMEIIATDYVTSYTAAVFSDSWRCGIKNVLFHQFRAYAACVVLNETGWTENFYAYNVNFRHCKHGFHFYTLSAWQSFYGTDIRDYYFNHGSGPGVPSQSVVLGDGTSNGYAFMYAAKLQYGGWIGTSFESGPHAGIYLKKYSIMSDCKLVENYDGTRQNQYGKYFHSIITEAPQSYAHVDMEYNSKQFSYIVIDPIAQGSTLEINGWNSIAYPMDGSGGHYTGQSTYGVRPGAGAPISVRGARMIYRTRIDSVAATVTTNTILRMRQLPPNTSWLVELKIYGPNHQNSRIYTVSTQGFNFLATVVAHEQLVASTGGSIGALVTTLSLRNSFTDNGLYCQTFNNAQAGSFSSGNGDAFDIVIPPAVYMGIGSNSGTPVAGNTYGIEIVMTQI